MQVLLRPNLRAIYMGAIVPALLAAVGLAVALGPWHAESWVRAIGWGLAAFGGLILALLLWQSRQPRLAYQDGHLLIYLRSGRPIRLPVELVQCAFLGAGPTPIRGPRGSLLRSANLVLRLDEKATDWQEADVKPALGRWTEGYVTIYGAWCEPLKIDVVQRLNERLHELNHATATSPESAGNKPETGA
jgi:hypothetical protein